jgi:pyruvate dehydrogenase E1 component alpha subunit
MQTATTGLDLLAAYRTMWLIRAFEDRIQELFVQGEVSGTTHLCQGQEAVCVGVASALRRDDYLTCTYRGHGHVLAKGADPTASMAEILGRSTGLCRGLGGSMHLADASCGALGSFAIVGAGLPIAVGAAWSARLRGTDQVAVACFGDGTANIGAFHEALNLAAVWRLPVLFVCENNLYMEYTPIADVTAVARPAADRAPAYGVPGEVVDGNDVVAVRETVAALAERARAGDGPAIVEAETYRHFGHSRADPAAYRPAEEVERWLKHDPLDLARGRLVELGVDEQTLTAADGRARDVVQRAVAAAKNAPPPDPREALTDVWADGGAAWRT